MSVDRLQFLLNSCKGVKSKRDIGSIHRSISAEVGELAEEVDIALGTSYKKAGPDGVVGEAVDVILGCLDIISVHNPDFTASQLFEYAVAKLVKWEDKIAEHQSAKNNQLRKFESDEDQSFHIRELFAYGRKIGAARMYIIVNGDQAAESATPRWHFTADECCYSMPGDDIVRQHHLNSSSRIIINHDYNLLYESIEDRVERVLSAFSIHRVGYKEDKSSSGLSHVSVNPHLNDLLRIYNIDTLCSALEREFFSTVAYVSGNNSLQFHAFDLAEKK